MVLISINRFKPFQNSWEQNIQPQMESPMKKIGRNQKKSMNSIQSRRNQIFSKNHMCNGCVLSTVIIIECHCSLPLAIDEPWLRTPFMRDTVWITYSCSKLLLFFLSNNSSWLLTWSLNDKCSNASSCSVVIQRN